MPDELLVLKTTSAAALLAALAVLLAGWPWRRPRQALVAAGLGLGFVAGAVVGARVLEIIPRLVPPGKEDTLLWGFMPRSLPPEDKDRLLLVVLPGVAVAEIVTALLRRAAWLKWLPRLVIAASA